MIQAAKAPLEARQRELGGTAGRHVDEDGHARAPAGRARQRGFGVPADQAQDNFTDPGSWIMKTADGFQQG